MRKKSFKLAETFKCFFYPQGVELSIQNLVNEHVVAWVTCRFTHVRAETTDCTRHCFKTILGFSFEIVKARSQLCYITLKIITVGKKLNDVPAELLDSSRLGLSLAEVLDLLRDRGVKGGEATSIS